MKKNVFVKAYGCSYSRYTAQAGSFLLVARGYDVYCQGLCSDREIVCTPEERKLICRVDSVILNTCTLTEYQEKDIISPAIEQIRILNKTARIFLAGCCLRNKYSSLVKGQGVVLLDWSAVVSAHAPLGVRCKGRLICGQIPIVLVKESCDKPCSYCVCGMRMKGEKQRTYQKIREEIDVLLGQGYRCICFAGPCYASWRDGKAKKDFGDLLRELLMRGVSISQLELYPGDVGEALLRTIEMYPDLVGELSVPVQHISGKILKKMSRKYTAQYLEKLFFRLDRIKGLRVTTDIIVGFPGETRLDLEELRDFICRHKIYRLDCYAFSFRQGSGMSSWYAGRTLLQAQERIVWMRENVVRSLGKGGFNDTTGKSSFD